MKDPGVIKFNHKLHLTPGQKIAADQLSPWTLGRMKKIDPGVTERYRIAPWQADKSDSAEVVLDCQSCHQPDLGTGVRQTVAGGLPTRAPGAYMAPVNFEQHCKACHPLQFDDANPKATVPHHLQPDKVREFVTSFFKSDSAKPDAAAARPLANRPLPGKAAPSTDPKLTDQERVERAMRTLFIGKKTCGECHYAEGEVSGSGYLTSIPNRIQVKPTAAVRDAGWFTQLTPIPEIWYTHAKFDHSKHRTVDCRDCHGAAFPFLDARMQQPNPSASTTHWDVMMPGIAKCRECHGPTRVQDGSVTAGVRHECTECHVYHHGDGIKRAGK